LGYLPQGSGKSVVIAMLASSAASKGTSTIVLTHRDEILKQNFNKMDTLGLRVEIVCSKTKSVPASSNLVVAMTQTVAARCRPKDDPSDKRYEDWIEWLGKFQLVIVDEAHRGEHDEVVSKINPNATLIGLSASILRAGNAVDQLGKYYQCIVKGVTTPELIQYGYLVGARSYAFAAPKLDDIEKSSYTGDFRNDKLQERFRQKERYAGVIENWKRICPGTKTVIFCTGAEHVIDLCKEFNNAGITAKYLISGRHYDTHWQYSGDRDKILAQFKRGEFPVLINIAILDTGWDESSIETVVLDLATESYTKYSQAIGRGSRPHKGKQSFNILDFGGNIERHGFFENPNPPLSLWHDKGGSGLMPTKVCPLDKGGCNRIIPAFSTDCPFCGYHFPTQHEIYTVELREIIQQSKEGEMTMEQWIADKIANEGWDNNRILITLCKKNPGAERQTFLKAVKLMRTKHGSVLSDNYWWPFKKVFLDKDKYHGNNRSKRASKT
jgi:hypothetical protein